MKYFLLDDDVHFHNQFKKIVSDKDINIDVTYFTKIDEFINDIENFKSNYNILFLDIDMPECDGITIARKICTQFNNVIIIFLTNRTDLMADAFGINVFKFLPKQTLVNTFESVIKELNQFISMSNMVSFNVNNENIIVRVNDILYFERHNRKSWMILKNGDNISLNYLTMDYIHARLDHQFFMYVNRGQIVNLNNIKRIKGNMITLVNEVNIYSSNIKKFEVNERYKENLFRI